MKDKHQLFFSVNDKLLGEQLSPDNISLPLLAEFAEQVASFLRGSSRVDLKEVRTSIKKGSFAIAIDEPTQALEPAILDYEKVNRHHTLNDIDPIRARIIEAWQKSASKNEDRIYKLLFSAEDANSSTSLVISSDTNYEIKKEQWVHVERYIYGSVYDLGGKNQPNVHLQLSNGKTIKVQANIDTLAEDRINRLYSKQLVRLKAEQNLDTKEYRNETLISFEKYKPHFDEDEFQATLKKGRIAWQGVTNATQWVEQLRGNYA